MRLIRIFALLLATTALTPWAAQAEDHPLKGVALVIGESDYEDLPKLDNPKRDARAMDDLLDELGFKVDRVLDADTNELRVEIAKFIDDAKGADVALVYYSGHGIEAGGADYLLPTDTSLQSAQSTGQSLVAVADMLQLLSQTVPVTIALLDACRTNPFPQGAQVQLPGTDKPMQIAPAGLEAMRGPTPVAQPQLSPDSLGMVIGFAASPGEPALDGAPGENSPYAAALLKHLGAGGYSLGDLMTMVSEEVYLKTKARQLPWVNSSLRRVLSFGKPVEVAGGDEAAIRDGRRQLLLTIARQPEATQKYVEDVATADGVPLDALYGMLKVLGVDTSSNDLQKQLEAGARQLKELMDSRPGGVLTDTELVRLTGLADQAETEGAIDLALKFRQQASARADELVKTVDANEANLKQDRLQIGATYAGHAKTASLNFDYATSAEMWGKAYEQVAKWDDALALEYLWHEAGAKAALGQFGGDAEALDAAISLYDKAAKLAEPGSDDLAGLRNDEAVALQTIGERRGDADALKQSVKAFTQALKNFPRADKPVEWARMESNLGNSYNMLGDQTGDPAWYGKGADAHAAALERLDRDQRPLDWATAQNNLGISLSRLGEREKGTKSLLKAVAAFNLALEERTQDKVPVDWGATQGNLANTLAVIADHEDSADRYAEAIEHFEASLTEVTRDRAPVDWAQTTRNLGIAAKKLAVKTGDLKWFDKAIAAQQDALTVFSKTDTPMDWAQTEADLGIAALARAQASGDRDDLQLARDAYAAAYEVYGQMGDADMNAYFEGKLKDIDKALRR